MASSSDPRLTLALLVGLGCVGMLVIFVVLPLLGRFSVGLEALSLLIEGLGEYFGNTRIVWLGCIVIFLTIMGCCLITIVLGGALITCNTGNPAALCRLVGR